MRRRLALVLGALSAFPAFTIDLYLPGMPAMARDLHADAGMVQLSVTVFVVGLALGQAVIGPLSDAHGRRPLLLLGLAAYVAGSLACLLAPTAGLLIAARVVQALGAAAATVLARVVARDHFEGRELTRFVSTLMLVNGVATVLGPVVGAQLLSVAPWRAVFLLLVVVGAVLLGEVRRSLPESLPVSRRRPADLRATAEAFGVLLRDRDYLRHTLAAALMFSAMFAYITGSSFVLQDTYGLSPQQYGAVFATNCLGIVLLGQVNAVLVGRLADERTLLGASLAVGAAAGLGVLAAIVLEAPLGALLACLFVLVSVLGPVLANATSLALSPHPGAAGTAASLQGVLQYAVSGAVASLMALATHDARSGAVAMGAAVAASAVAALLVLRVPAPWRTPLPSHAVSGSVGPG
ncbi:DHA1 family bicyclomycin/chloramphenicol resistance-like MFS transporter [Nocardioides cavernae]|uniref:DHA1 family bicyclomycin/chloramphenicol resistance-like MFS transporter n=1 Tax=Nocardioides cavernae TaxID=1921566 RepID=A0A7Y9H064_9ACTN|nr:multidrug effflux MFS transporter [Nocardioides cavernae]NYE35557.1 DHA1 family bicyclomycin/chloramphenicol resistance-like MFS transporter [Nocardioides cavernae]